MHEQKQQADKLRTRRHTMWQCRRVKKEMKSGQLIGGSKTTTCMWEHSECEGHKMGQQEVNSHNTELLIAAVHDSSAKRQAGAIKRGCAARG